VCNVNSRVCNVQWHGRSVKGGGGGAAALGSKVGRKINTLNEKKNPIFFLRSKIFLNFEKLTGNPRNNCNFCKFIISVVGGRCD